MRVLPVPLRLLQYLQQYVGFRQGDRGWEVFSLLYHLQSPLSTIFTPHAMESYLRLFNFLWRLKRVETALNSTWAQSHILARGR